MNPAQPSTMKGAVLIATLLLFTAPISWADDSAWQAPFNLQLPETVRTIVLRPRTDAAEFAADHGLTGARIVPMGRGTSALEMPMDDTAWEAVQSGACSDRDVASCESSVCQGIQNFLVLILIKFKFYPGTSIGDQPGEIKLLS